MWSDTYTYWGRIASLLGMKYDVINAWSGGTVCGLPGISYQDAGVLRATELDNDNGTPDDPSDDIPPDLIIFYLGTNDMNGTRGVGELSALLNEKSDAESKAALHDWLEQLKSANAVPVPDTTYRNFDQAYALALLRMMEKYPDAEIICVRLCGSGIDSCTEKKLARYNFVIDTLAQYFGLPLVDNGVSAGNYWRYAQDVPGEGLHPGVCGHGYLAEKILTVLAGEQSKSGSDPT